MHYLWLFIAVMAETLGTTAVQASHQFTRLWPSVAVVVFYVISFYCMSLTLRVMPVGVVYALWAGLGIVFIAIIGFLLFGQRLDAPALLGIALIICGILVIHLFSKTSPH
ncbi:Multidrug transporter EmrE [Sulfitobacter indolifex]|uniref:Small multidrug resistance protein n=1 Tax=Sulfitobacter indolifex HEL-45 TaxID=391624 RepID=A0ABM9X546_9RHOB|nr:multidrug efflux SMR transporter [Sulfitobacter indolifex]EDQ04580.1 small multidrug resistance protein [Sulfitobacter indolifex HEL-45]UOA18673.1 Multidrug transporter EmrE [Sulfitobacter indolifex]|tara:strand:+ start:670 stop:999 length:330 start_codon:yes stop_codon:yes gene_type:complete